MIELKSIVDPSMDVTMATNFRWFYPQNWLSSRQLLVVQPGRLTLGFALHLFRNCKRTDRRTCKHTDVLIPILRIVLRAKWQPSIGKIRRKSGVIWRGLEVNKLGGDWIVAIIKVCCKAVFSQMHTSIFCWSKRLLLHLSQSNRWAGGIMFSGCLCMRACVHASICARAEAFSGRFARRLVVMSA